MWDKFVAFNAMYADLCRFMDEDEIIKAAYAFYFHDDDWQNDGDCTKIWDYMTHHYLSLEEDTAASFLAYARTDCPLVCAEKEHRFPIQKVRIG